MVLRKKLSCVLTLSSQLLLPACIACSSAQDAPEFQSVVVRLLTPDGKPVSGADVGFYVTLRETGRDLEYYSGGRSNDEGIARLRLERNGEWPIYARHAGKRLVGLHLAPFSNKNRPLEIQMTPECHIVGTLRCEELQRLERREQRWTNVYVGKNGKRFGSSRSYQQRFEFFLPAGDFELTAYGTYVHEVTIRLNVARSERQIIVSDVELEPTQLARLVGRPAPQLSDIAAWTEPGPVTLSEMQGKPVILYFWGYWCPPCIETMPKLFAVYERYKDRGLQIIGVHVDHDFGEQPVDSAEILERKLAPIRSELWEGRGVPFPVALCVHKPVPHKTDPNHVARCELAAKFGIVSYPTAILIRADGKVEGMFNYRGEDGGMGTMDKLLAIANSGN